MAKIAAVLCNYNDSRFLIRAVARICEQGFDEVIVVDDTSTDRSLELLKCLQTIFQFQIISNTEKKGPFGTFISGCKASKSKYIACFSADDYPNLEYGKWMRKVIGDFPIVDVYTCNAKVIREGKEYERTLLPFTSYISPEYMVKIGREGFAKNINQCGIIINREFAIKCWNEGGKDTEVNFDGMYTFAAAFLKGLVHVGKPLVTYVSYPTSYGASGNYIQIRQAIDIQEDFFQELGILDKAIESGIWATSTQWKSLIALWSIMKLPKWIRLRFYDWFYSYSSEVEKL
jgi:glycosyltransferase involved in cell wall biosynthesis